MTDISLVLLLLVIALAFANGTNDVSKAIATLVGSGITNYRTAILWGTIWTVAGAGTAAVLAKAMVKTFSNGLIAPGLVVPHTLALSVLVGAIGWVLFASRAGLPVSTTHALTGAIVGGCLVAFGRDSLIWTALGGKIVLPLMLSPVLALSLSILLHPLTRLVAGRWEGACLCLMPSARALVVIDAQGMTQTLIQTSAFGRPVIAVPTRCEQKGLAGLTIGLGSVHWLSSGLASLARGTNDAPKIVAMLLLGGITSSWNRPTAMAAAFASVAVAMGIGSYLGGLRVTEVLAEKVSQMDHLEGLSANMATSSLVLVSATMGLPVSTTHVSSSAIIGIGLLKGIRTVRWTTVRDMVLAWVVTLPASGLFAMFTYLILTKLRVG